MTRRAGAALLALLIALPLSAATVWREGEDPTTHKMNRHPWWYDKVKAARLDAARGGGG